MNTQDLLNRLAEDGIQNLWIAFHDYNGRACAKTIPSARFEAALGDGVVFARANLDFAFDDHMAPDAMFHAETGDFLAVPDPDSYRRLPYLEHTAIVVANLLTEQYEPFAGCPRTALRNLMDAYAARGLRLTCGFETEFSLWRKTGDGEYEPANDDAMYSLIGLNRFADLMHGIVATLETMDIRVAELGKEYGPSQYEFTVRYDSPLAAADQYLVAKEVVRALALKQGLIASYMPKPYAHTAGNGLHVHLGIVDAQSGANLLSGGSRATPLSDMGLHFAGGMLKHAAGLAGVGAPTVNSYKRLQPNSWAPAHIAWGVGNRGALIRVPDVNKRCRVEFRAGDATCNPYIFLASLLAAGLDGLDQRIDPGKPVSDEDLGLLNEAELQARGIGYLPRALPEALAAFEGDRVLTAPLSPVIASEFLKIKRWEMQAYNLHVHPWERRLYLEAI